MFVNFFCRYLRQISCACTFTTLLQTKDCMPTYSMLESQQISFGPLFRLNN